MHIVHMNVQIMHAYQMIYISKICANYTRQICICKFFLGNSNYHRPITINSSQITRIHRLICIYANSANT